MRASRPTAPAGVTSNGLISISAISGCAAATRESAAAASAAARTSTGSPAARSGQHARAAQGEQQLLELVRRRPGASATRTSRSSSA